MHKDQPKVSSPLHNSLNEYTPNDKSNVAGVRQNIRLESRTHLHNDELKVSSSLHNQSKEYNRFKQSTESDLALPSDISKNDYSSSRSSHISKHRLMRSTDSGVTLPTGISKNECSSFLNLNTSTTPLTTAHVSRNSTTTTTGTHALIRGSI